MARAETASQNCVQLILENPGKRRKKFRTILSTEGKRIPARSDVSACNAGVVAVGKSDGDGRLLIVSKFLGLDLANF